ncbi:uncharacterized protein KD926_006943 [Aspergillus affinis]|uniref:uncharacterized protein n=1 Tax=Aspergillus affinis TaxID=1070780 RepID=UPI0022FDDC77|nr:uncharacterized protein KD926_006943 [Aspergillus affinis]KAI9041367.1 hypothetical protein KD926_006943 [Aspergillus affinis]
MPPDRAKNACTPCRERKRKCDGQEPCHSCAKANYECKYDHRPRTRRPARKSPTEGSTQPSQVKPTVASDETISTRLSADVNSAAVLAKKLGLSSTEPAIPGGLRLFAWNLGIGEGSTEHLAPLPLREILTVGDMQKLASVYFAEVHTAYNFADRDLVDIAIETIPEQQLFDPVQCVLLGIAALACLFSPQPKNIEARIVHSARAALEQSTTLELPSVDHVTGWLLRVFYLRLTSSPHAAWMASCAMMHMVETTNLHLEPSDTMTTATNIGYTPNSRRRLYCVSQLFHMWICYDYGRSRVNLRGASCSLPTEGWTADQITIWQLSDALDVDKYLDTAELEDLLRRTIALKLSHPLLQLKRCSIGMCIYRRLRASGRTVTSDVIGRVLQLAGEGVDTAVDLAYKRSPWWHIAHVPFQVICVLLFIDSRPSLEGVRKSFRALQVISDCYVTNVLKEAVASASYIIGIQLQRKKEEYDLLNSMASDILPNEMNDAGSLEQSSLNPDLGLQPTDTGHYNYGEFLDLDQLFTANLFAPYG